MSLVEDHHFLESQGAQEHLLLPSLSQEEAYRQIRLGQMLAPYPQFKHIQTEKGTGFPRQGYSDHPTCATGFQPVVLFLRYNIPCLIPGPWEQDCSPCQWTAYSCTSRADREGMGKRSKYVIISFSLKST